MKFRKKKQVSRTEPSQAKPDVAPAGTPTAESASEVPSPQATEVAPVKMETAVGESLDVAKKTDGERGPFCNECGYWHFENQPHIVNPLKTATTMAPPVTPPVTRSGGASWFVPAQKPSGFGMGGTK